MREALLLLFLIISYNFALWYITEFGLSPVPLFPEDVDHRVLVLSYNSVLYLSWVFGERERIVQWMGYLFFVQIVALSFYFRDLEIIVRDLPPVILTFMLVALFESPTERERKLVEKEREDLLKEIDRVRRERERNELRLRSLEEEIRRLEEEKREGYEEKIAQLQREIKELKEKEARLIEANRKLFQLLDMLRTEGDAVTGREELTSLRRERKKLIKELLQLQELLDLYVDENEKLKEESEKLRKKVSELERKLGELQIEAERFKETPADLKRRVLEEVFSLSFCERAVEEFERIPPDKRKSFVRELLKIAGKGARPEPLTTVREIYKVRFSGGRIYLRKKGGSWEVVGFLDSENDKEKDRYIREVLSKIV
jgi:predicted  nucleic acid-binding Zn-ribbon protein